MKGQEASGRANEKEQCVSNAEQEHDISFRPNVSFIHRSELLCGTVDSQYPLEFESSVRLVRTEQHHQGYVPAWHSGFSPSRHVYCPPNLSVGWAVYSAEHRQDCKTFHYGCSNLENPKSPLEGGIAELRRSRWCGIGCGYSAAYPCGLSRPESGGAEMSLSTGLRTPPQPRLRTWQYWKCTAAHLILLCAADCYVESRR